MWYSSIKYTLLEIKNIPHGTSQENQEKLLQNIKLHNSKVIKKEKINFPKYPIGIKPATK
jgi:hypothetical protein